MNNPFTGFLTGEKSITKNIFLTVLSIVQYNTYLVESPVETRRTLNELKTFIWDPARYMSILSTLNLDGN